MRSPLLAGALTVAAALVSAAPAAGDSIVYLRDWNVWLANSDGSGQYQVTTNGTEGLPYLSPSQADDGTIAVARYDKIVLLRQNGSVIREIDPQPLSNTYSHQVDGSPKYVAISPDGSRIAFSYVSFEGNDAQATTGFVAADGTPLPGNLFNGFPSWVTNTRSLTSGGGYGWHVNIHDQGQAVEARWMNDNQADLRDAEVNSQGTFVALVRDAHTDRGTETSIWAYQIVGDVKTGSPDPVPQARCGMGPEPTLSDPSWSPNGQSLVWSEAGNLWTIDRADTCEGQPRQLLAGGSDPDWGPAPVNPGPRETPPDERRPEPERPQPQPRRPQPRAAAKPVVKAPKSPARFATAGLRVSYRCAGACTVSATATVDRATARALRVRSGARLGSGARRLKRAGTATVVVRPAAALRRRLARLRGARVTVRVVVRAAGAKARTYRALVVLRR